MAVVSTANEARTCAVCGEPFHFRWTDTHGVAVCGNCGLPYRLYHYKNDVRVDKPPTIAVKEEWLPLARQYWQERRRRVFPMAYDVGIFRGRGGRSYSGATEDDCEAFEQWLAGRKTEWPVASEA